MRSKEAQDKLEQLLSRYEHDSIKIKFDKKIKYQDRINEDPEKDVLTDREIDDLEIALDRPSEFTGRLEIIAESKSIYAVKDGEVQNNTLRSSRNLQTLDTKLTDRDRDIKELHQDLERLTQVIENQREVLEQLRKPSHQKLGEWFDRQKGALGQGIDKFKDKLNRVRQYYQILDRNLDDKLREYRDRAIDTAAQIKADALDKISRTKQELRDKILSYPANEKLERENQNLREEKRRYQADLRAITARQQEIKNYPVLADPWSNDHHTSPPIANKSSDEREQLDRQESRSKPVLALSYGQMSAADYWLLEKAGIEKQIAHGIIPPYEGMSNYMLQYSIELKLSGGLIEVRDRTERRVREMKEAGISEEKIRQLKPEIEDRFGREISQRWREERSVRLSAYLNNEPIPPTPKIEEKVLVTSHELRNWLDRAEYAQNWQSLPKIQNHINAHQSAIQSTSFVAKYPDIYELPIDDYREMRRVCDSYQEFLDRANPTIDISQLPAAWQQQAGQGMRR